MTLILLFTPFCCIDWVWSSRLCCSIGVTGMLCAPTYVFDNCTFTSSQPTFFWSSDLTSDNMAEAAIFILAPGTDAAAGTGASPFPANYTSLASSKFATFLLPHDACVSSDTLGMSGTYANGILCATDVRIVKIWTFDMVESNAPLLLVELWHGESRVFATNTTLYAIGGAPTKQGYRFPVFPGTDHYYKISLSDGSAVPADWVIEFSDPIFGNRYQKEYLDLRVENRSCPAAGVSSQHDRLFVFSSSKEYLGVEARGHGACTEHADTPSVDCSTAASIELLDCDACGDSCGEHAYCGCDGSCVCEAGFAGDGCNVDICADAACGSHGHCTATYLGGDLVPMASALCVCDDPWLGDKCSANPCANAPVNVCSNHGTCTNVNVAAYTCDCDDGYTGANCSSTCVGTCVGDYPHNCNPVGGEYVF